jgi:phospholipase C
LTAPDERNASATVAAYDARAAERASCNVQAGARTTDTIGPEVPHGDALPFEHVVLLMLENRSLDHYFRGLAKGPTTIGGVRLDNYAGQIDVGGCDAARGHTAAEAHDCHGETETDYNVDPWTNTKVHQFHETRYCTVDTAHNWEHVHRQFNLATSDGHSDGLMDGFVASNNVYGPGGGGGRSMGYYDERDIPYYYWLANTFSISDRHFCSLLGPTWPNRYYYLSATSFGRTRTPDYPVKGGDNLIELLKRNDHSVEVYRDGAVSFSAGAYANLDYTGKSMWRSQNRVGDGNGTWEALVAGDRLPDVSILDPSFSNSPWPANDEHPPHNVQLGQNLIARVVGTLMSNVEVWRKTVLIITYDEHGGYYDHVEPPPACTPDDDPANAEFDRLGPRVPIFVISPWTKKHYVSHTVTDLTSVTRFVENRFDLPALTRRDAAAWPLLDMFDFENPPFWTPPQNPMELARVDQAHQDWCAQNPPGNGVDPASAAEAGVTPVPLPPPSQCVDDSGHTVTPQQGEREPNDGLHQLEHRGDVSDLNWAGLSWTEVEGTLAGSDDTDLYHWNAIDHVYAYNDPTLKLVDAPAGVHACLFLACKSGTTIQTGGEDAEAQQSIDDEYCDGGTAKWAASGTIKGCCVAAGETTRLRGYDCIGLRDDDSADLVIKVYSDPPQTAEQAREHADRLRMCLPYDLEFHF